MDTRHLRSFLKIADTGSISRAAESLGISQPSLSQQLLRLEDEVGTALFRRTARGVTLTEAGRVFQEHARQLMRGADQAVADVRMLQGEASGTVILAVPYAVSRVAGLALVTAFRTHAPGIAFRLVEAFTGQIRGWLEDGKVDLGVLNDLGPLRHLSSRRLAREELFLIGPAGQFGTLEAPAQVPAARLAAHQLILPGAQHGLRQLVEMEAARLGLHLLPVQELDALAHVGALVAAGLGHSVMPLPAIADDLAAGRISVARLGDGGLHRTLALVRNPAQVMTHASVRGEDLAIKVLAGLIESRRWRAEPDAALR